MNTPPANLKALGKKSLPDSLELEGQPYRLAAILKNDFFAVTGRYESDGRSVILKVQRQASFLLIPLRWIGRILAAKERAALTRLADLPGIPKLLGEWGGTGLIREYIKGETLADVVRVDDQFHHRLRGLIDAIHARGMAYVDLEKRENVLIDREGRPCLFDFQIAWYVPRRWGGDLWPLTAARRWFQRGDLYHLQKLKRRTRPDLLSEEERKASYRKPWFVKLHGFFARPMTRLRRRILKRWDPERKSGERGRLAPF